MKSFIVLALFVAAAVAAPQSRSADADAVILGQEFDNIGVDGFKSAYETSNGISANEQGQLENVGTEDEGIQVRGQFSYRGDDGIQYTVTYTAGKEGFVPSGDHIPKA